MKTIKIASTHTDIAVCLLMALMIYVVFPFGRWIDHATLSTLLLLSFYYLTYVVNRTLTVPSFFRARWRPLLSVLILGGFVAVMAALTYYREGWPFYQLADAGKVTLGQQRAWLPSGHRLISRRSLPIHRSILGYGTPCRVVVARNFCPHSAVRAVPMW